MPAFGKASALRDELTPTLLAIAIFSCMGAVTFGFDNAWWGSVLGQTYFNEVFGTLITTSPTTGVVTRSLTASQQSAGTALGTAGIAIGCMIAGQVCRLYGRKRAFYFTAIGSVAGVVVQITSAINATTPGSGRHWQLVAGKIIICISIGVASVAVPLYLTEAAPKEIRGALTNFYVEVQAIGTLVASCVFYAVQNDRTQKVWMLPIGLQLLAPVIMLACGWALPESPRWLVERGRLDNARDSLLLIRRGKDGYTPDDDIHILETAYAHERANAHSATWASCFRGQALRRTQIVVGIQCLQQGQGISFMANYLVVFLLQLGVTNVYALSVGINALIAGLTAAGFFVQDYFGRRSMLIGGGTVMGVSLLSVAGLTSSNGPLPTAKANACVGLIFIWVIGFSQSWTNIPWTISAEVPSDMLRDKTLAIGAFGGYVVGMLVGLVNPYMQNAEYGDLGGKVGFVYGAISVSAIIWCYFFIPELKGKSLEEIDFMFDVQVPYRKMGAFVVPREELMGDGSGASHDKVGGGGEDDKKMDIEHVA